MHGAGKGWEIIGIFMDLWSHVLSKLAVPTKNSKPPGKTMMKRES